MPDAREAETRRAAVYRSDGGGGDRTSLRLVVYGPGSFNAYPLPHAGTLTLGRSTTVDVPIDDPQVSRQHARLHVGGTLELEDLGSANGTKCRNEPLAPHERRPIAPGDVIALGAWLCVVQTGSGPLFLWTDSALVERLQRELGDAARTQRELVLLHLAVDGVAAAPAVEDILRGTLGAHDVVASPAPGRFDLFAPRLAAAAAGELGERLCRQLRDLGFAPRLARAVYPHDAATAAELVQRARRELAPTAGAAPAAHPSMARLEALVERVAPGTISVLILGETGVGKEVLAERIHQPVAARARSPFVRAQLRGARETLLESELFGHERGAFTGAVQAKPRPARGRRRRHASSSTRSASCRCRSRPSCCACSRSARCCASAALKPRSRSTCASSPRPTATSRPRSRAARFRQDLVLPAQRRHARDPAAARARRRDRAAGARVRRRRPAQREPPERADARRPSALALLERYAWPGNIRELRNVVERAVLLCAGDVIEPEHLPLSPEAATAGAATAVATPARTPAVATLRLRARSPCRPRRSASATRRRGAGELRRQPDPRRQAARHLAQDAGRPPRRVRAAAAAQAERLGLTREVTTWVARSKLSPQPPPGHALAAAAARPWRGHES